ncbi:hypothetical protein K1T71_008720 [Dendrolimus kikuchii]|uniref:Uncharacterized protein n=1 Tax=Dendrolimus kikuchii TaxID=765133 RepID=A0ACC1CV51_9NEOP|nr:hypothetical protein K1T71_008720 [Dendrolimus kikuchii]
MNNGLPWTLLLVLHFLVVISHPIQNYNTNTDVGLDQLHEDEMFKNNNTNEKIISVRITSSVAVGRQKGRLHKSSHDNHRNKTNNQPNINPKDTRKAITTETYVSTSTDNQSELHPDLAGANIEFIKQLYAKKGSKDHHSEYVHPFQVHIQNQNRYDDLIQDTTTVHPFEEKESSDDLIIANPLNDTNHISDAKIGNYQNINKTSQANANNDNINLNKSDEILVHSSTKLVLDFTSDNAENYESNEDSFMSTVENENMSNNKSEIQKYQNGNESYDTIAESSITSFTVKNNNENIENNDDIENVPLARSVSFPRGAQNYIDNIRRTTNLEREPKSQLTTISFSIIHDPPKDFEQTNNKYVPPSQPLPEPKKLDHPIVYSEPAKIYSEPAKFYSEPAKIYSEPAKIYSEPAKVYSEPAKIYSEPAKFYSEPASLHLPDQQKIPIPITSSINSPLIENTPSKTTNPTKVGAQIQKNYDQTHERSTVIQDSSTEKCQEDSCKVGYVVEGRQFKKYRVEERTSDGFIVGEYGVVRNEDGALRGVRYTADSDASPRLIYDALMKFLQLR